MKILTYLGNFDSYIDFLISGLVGLRQRQDDFVEVNPLAPDQWNYFRPR